MTRKPIDLRDCDETFTLGRISDIADLNYIPADMRIEKIQRALADYNEFARRRAIALEPLQCLAGQGELLTNPAST